ncbi:F0F1 ATP synthase subunit epsilon [Jeotgalicoccus huakuii]|uniref:F0F1 ATP synthase subunit epsilon n=1 Tax=Jeotgalicoccus TaxID=227979 RepID=UPI000418EE45|nr:MULTISPECIES: F0F1 ATP synthase subunit epsilon [Jeotgalicoccus]MCK1975848.1 F0F1 ATP synthase subunit epsilon [Jeotgalicoccus huakuii]QQD84867.1 F0F1 ATP synthase subunit epsilon [Jeotgalicoccus sp. ATCC 8456]
MATIALDVVTPNGSVFHEEDCEIVVLQTVQGELGVMAGHIPTVTPLKIGVLRVKIDGKFEYLAVTEGFAEIKPEQVTVLVQAGEFSAEIDTERAEAAKKRAEELLNRAQDERVDKYRAELALHRAVNRLEVSKY